MRFAQTFSPTDSTLQKNIEFAHPELIHMMGFDGSNLFIDGTFKICPRPYNQVLVLMAYVPSIEY